MNGFLVMFSGEMDDIPLYFTADKDAAKQYAESIAGIDDERVQRAIDVMKRDTSTQCCICIVEFSFGLPVAWISGKDLG